MLRLPGLFLIIYILFPAWLSAQVDPKFGFISSDEWALETCEFDQEATAVYLFCMGEMKLTYGQYYSYEIHEKIKILDKAGLEHAQLNIQLLKNYDETISSFKGIIHKNDGTGTVSEIKVNKKDLINVDLNEDFREERIVFPDVKPGDIIEYKYNILTSNLVFPDPWYFQRELPVIYSKFNFLIESGLVYKYFIVGKRLENLRKEVGNENSFTLKNIPSYNKEEFVFNSRKYRDMFRLQMESYYKTDRSGLARSGTVDVTTNWKSIVNHPIFHSRTAPYLRERNSNSLSLINEQDIIDSLYNYVSMEFAWDQNYRLVPDQSVNNLEKLKSGNSAEINLYLCGLLRSNGIKASPLWISTRSFGQPIKQFPLITQFNHVLIAIETENGYKIISAINKNYPQDYLNVEEYNELGFLLDPDQLEWIDIPNSKGNYEHIELIGDINEEAVTFNIQVSLSGLSALTLGTQYSDPPEKHPMTGLTSLKPEDGQLENWKTSKLIEYSLKKIVNDQSGDIFYLKSIPGDLFFKRNPFSESERSLPLEVPFPVRRSISVKIPIPEGYELAEIPEPIAITLPNKKGKFVMSVSVMQSIINVFGQVEINDQLFTTFEYPYLKAFIDQVIEKQNSPLVLIPKK